MNNERLNKMDMARRLLPEPGPEFVGELIAELRDAYTALCIAINTVECATLNKDGTPLLWYRAAKCVLGESVLANGEARREMTGKNADHREHGDCQ
jgi:hypothetical protein